MGYSTEYIQFLIDERAKGERWVDISASVHKKFNIKRSPASVRAVHAYYTLKEYPEDQPQETQVYKDTANAKRALYRKTNEISTLRNMVSDQDQYLKEITEVVKTIPKLPKKAPKKRKSKSKSEAILELMLSDLHIGLEYGDEFNYRIAEERMNELCKVTLEELARAESTYNVQKLIINSLGDVIHNELLHPCDSVRASAGPNPQQAVEATRIIYNNLLVPLVLHGVDIEVNCVPGNHDRTDVKRPICLPGECSWSWVIYNSLDQMFKVSKSKNITFNITAESFLIVDVFDDKMLVTHGDEIKAPTPVAIETYIHQRSKQTGVLIDYLRMGHYHEYKMFGRGRFILTDSFCGQDHFAKKMGYSSPAGQVINYYVENSTRPTTFYKSFPIYLG